MHPQNDSFDLGYYIDIDLNIIFHIIYISILQYNIVNPNCTTYT